MILAWIDWVIILAYLLVSILISLYFGKNAGKNTNNFFLSGRNLPWYVAGTSMVATTFAADTPLAVTELVAQNGIAGNWLWWNMVFGGILTVFFFARLWRRAGIMTDAEFVSIRYNGKSASFLRGFRALYVGIGMNAVVIAWVNLAMVKIVQVIFPDFTLFGITEVHFLGITFSSHLLLVGIMLIFVSLYSSISGLMGVSITDTFQFILAMTGSIILAIFVIDEVGGISALQEKLAAQNWVFEFFPSVGNEESTGGAGQILQMSVVAFVAYLGVQWWASWYPGAEPGGGGYVAQRMMSAKDEKHSLLATLWFQVAHFAVRPWPWILVALSTLVLYPDVTDRGAAYVMTIRDFMPAGLLGLLLAAFLAAYMSTLASQTVWGTSYIINDLYRPFIKPNATEAQYVKVSRLTNIGLMIFSFLLTTQFDKISDAWKFILACSGGIGLVLLLRWYWWRINAWSEISALLAPYVVYPIMAFYFEASFEITLLVIVAWSTLVWIVVTYLTKPTDNQTLLSFYTKVHPGGIGWRHIAAQLPDVPGDTHFGRLFVNWAAGVGMVLLSLFGTGKLIFGDWQMALLLFASAIGCGAVIFYNFNRMGWKKAVE